MCVYVSIIYSIYIYIYTYVCCHFLILGGLDWFNTSQHASDSGLKSSPKSRPVSSRKRVSVNLRVKHFTEGRAKSNNHDHSNILISSNHHNNHHNNHSDILVIIIIIVIIRAIIIIVIIITIIIIIAIITIMIIIVIIIIIILQLWSIIIQ